MEGNKTEPKGNGRYLSSSLLQLSKLPGFLRRCEQGTSYFDTPVCLIVTHLPPDDRIQVVVEYSSFQSLHSPLSGQAGVFASRAQLKTQQGTTRSCRTCKDPILYAR
mmetsp:Transcript_56768/g.138144  ORF Transcript_56768/g.138144 Transcript_56768/m.138144 type:complete len:107 (+) Transcript_56768:734-1054(+)